MCHKETNMPFMHIRFEKPENDRIFEK